MKIKDVLAIELLKVLLKKTKHHLLFLVHQYMWKKINEISSYFI